MRRRGAAQALGEQFLADGIAVAASHGIDDIGLEFADIAPKGVLPQETHCRLADRRRYLAHGGGRFRGQVGGQSRYILRPLAQGRQADEVGAEPVVEVHAELTLPAGDHGQIFVGGGDDACLAVLGAVRAERVVDIFLEKAQQLDLADFTQVTDFVKKNRATGSFFKKAGPHPVGPGVSPLGMAEEGVGKQGVVEAGDVDRHITPGQAADLVNRLGDQLLSRAGLAEDQYRHAAGGNRFNVGKNRLHGRIAGDDPGKGRVARPAAGKGDALERQHLGPQQADLQGIAQGRAEHLEVDGFDQIVVGPESQALDGGLDFGIGGNNDHRHLWVAALELAQHLLAGKMRHVKVEEDDGVVHGFDSGHHLAAVAFDLHLPNAHGAEE